jgi:hypothetical protein
LSSPVFTFYSPGLIFGGTECVGFRFLVLRDRTHYRRYPRRRVPFSSLALSDSFSAVPSASNPIFMFCAPRLIFGGTGDVVSCFHVLRSRTRFRRYRGRRVLFPCFALPDSFSTVPEASCPVFLFCAPGLFFGGSEGVGSRFLILQSLTHFRRYRGRRVPFSHFALPDSFSAVSGASRPVFLFCLPGFVFGGSKGAVSRFHVLRVRTHFR